MNLINNIATMKEVQIRPFGEKETAVNLTGPNLWALGIAVISIRGNFVCNFVDVAKKKKSINF